MSRYAQWWHTLRTFSLFDMLVILAFMAGGIVALWKFAAALANGPDDLTRRSAITTTTDTGIALLLAVAVAGVVVFAVRFPQITHAVGWRFIVAWLLMLCGGVLRNLLPSLVTLSMHTLMLLANPLYGIGALLFVSSLLWPGPAPKNGPPTESPQRAA